MRRFVLSLVIVLGTGPGDAQTLPGVYGPPQSAAGKLGGVYEPPQPAPLPRLQSTIAAPDYEAEHGPSVSLPGDGAPGEELPGGVKPSPIPDRPGYGRAMVNDRPAIIDLNTNRIVRYSD